jgi:hypothetical protein
MIVKVRPFRTIVDYGPLDPSLAAEGRLAGMTYMLAIGSAEFSLTAIEVGEDERGPFALIEECETIVKGGARLSVEIEAPGEWDADLPIEALESTIRLYTLPPEAERLKAEHPEANMIVPRSSCVSFDFSCTGEFTSAGALQRMPSSPPLRH